MEYAKKELLSGHYEQGKQWARKALRADPVYIPAWLSLAELENNSGNPSHANEILEYLDNDLMRDILRWRWDKAMLAYLLGREDILTADLAWLLQQDNLTRETRKKALDFAFSLWSEPAVLLEKMGEENAEKLFYHAVDLQKLETADFLWPNLNHTRLEAEKILMYINMLIKSEKTDTAARLWKEFYPNDTLLYNGQFTLPLVKGGFGWRIWSSEGAAVDLQTPLIGPSSLHVRFNGEKNINFQHVNQIIPLHPTGENFTLTGELRSKGLTTDQRPFVEVLGIACSFRAVTDMVAPDQEWTQFSLNFSIPEDCRQGILVRLRRLPSRKIDSHISGDLWMTNFSLQPASQNASQ
ncbi:MAG: hypothetical protein D3906_01575 [Candidatus Electrothrix sp. AUS1_2]|nr:hypothetical protein [Candidatus Electrothrix sp. AUS1_2]